MAGWKPILALLYGAGIVSRLGRLSNIMLSVLVLCLFLLQVMVVLLEAAWVPACHMMLGGGWVVSRGLVPASFVKSNIIGYLPGSKGEHL